METSVEKDINKTIDVMERISIEDIQSRHRKERKELQAKIQALKKNAPKSDKKKRKEVLEEISKLESELEKKQEQEIKEAENKMKLEVEEEQPANNVSHHSLSSNLDDDNQDDQQQQETKQRITKAQKRRDKKAREARQREEEIKAIEEISTYGLKSIEAAKIETKLKERELALYNIRSDGNCLYNAIRHQLLLHGLAILSVNELRCETANYIQANKENLIPYMSHPDTGESLTDIEFQKYCDDIRNNSAWGGQIELKALSTILKVPIEVLQADGSPTIQGAEYGGSHLIITYHRHIYSLGEHYNSTIPLADAPKNDSNEDIVGGN